MTETNDAGENARTGEDESNSDKSTEPTLTERIIDGALGGALAGLFGGLAAEIDQREPGYYASLDGGRVEITYVPEHGEERRVADPTPEYAQKIYRALSGDEDVRYCCVKESASGEALSVYPGDTPTGVPVMQILAADRDSLETALASVLEDEGAADLLEGVKGVLCSSNDYEVLDAKSVKVSYKGEAGFSEPELAALRDSEYCINGICPDYIVVGKEGSADV